MTAQELERSYRNHILLDGRRRGETKTLKGDVMVLVIFVNDPMGQWTERAKKDYCRVYFAAMKKIEDAAREYGVRLKMMNIFDEVTLRIHCTMDNIRSWTDAAVEKKTFRSIMEMQRHYKLLYNCDEAPVVFVFNRNFRSYAQAADAYYPYGNEFCVASKDGSTKTVIHELLHQFGAEDLYYPRAVCAAADRFLPHSVMGSSAGESIDPLTAYLIGWRESVDNRVVQVLEATKHLTRLDIENELKAIWKKK